MPLPRAERAINIADLKELARRRLPRILFDWVEGGAEDERGLSRNEAQFARYRLLPRYLENVERIDLATTLLGRRFDAPFGIAPTGFAGLLRPDADLMLVVNAGGGEGLGFGAGEGGQEHSGENGNDGDDDEEFNQGEAAAGWRAVGVCGR